MPKCVACGGDVSLLSQKRCIDGQVCQTCIEKIPRVLYISLSMYTADELTQIINYENDLRAAGFEVTASYGKLYLDEMNGLFAIGEKSGQTGKLGEGFDIFDGAYLDNIGLYPIDPRQSRKDVVCDVEFSCVYKYPRMKFKLKVLSGVKCEFHQITKTKATWNEPGDLTMFRNMLDQTIKTSVKIAMEKREQILSPYDLDLLKARAALHVYEGCSDNLINTQYHNLKRMYETGDYAKEERSSYIRSLEHYRNLLLQGGNR